MIAGIFNAQRLRAWRAAAMHFFLSRNMGAMVINNNTYSMVVAFDGTPIESTKPDDRTLAMGAYSGYHGHHGATVVCVSSVCGVIVGSSRVFGGHDNDLTVHDGSAFNGVLNDVVLRGRLLADPLTPNFIAAADGIFNETTYVATTKQIHMNDAERERSKALSAFRVHVEHSFAELKNYFKKLKFGANLRWGQNLIEPIIILSILLSNCRICLEGRSQSSQRFGVPVPTLEEYLNETHDQITIDLINNYL